MTAIWLSGGAALAIAAVAAVSDHRTGLIPNWLTLPPLAVAPVAWGLYAGWGALPVVLSSIGLCGLVPYILFRKSAAGGGDVKLLAAIGAVAGLSVGLAAQLFALTGAALFALGRLAARGELLATLKNSVLVATHPVLPKKWRRSVAPEALTVIRLGPFVFLGTLLAVVERVLFP